MSNKQHLAYELWDLDWEPQVFMDYIDDEFRMLGIGTLYVGYGLFTDDGFEYPLHPAARYLPENLRRNFPKLSSGKTLKPCPFCGHQPDEDNLIDSIHPVTRECTVWTAGCVDNEGGCNASVLGGTAVEAINNWNKRV